MFPDSLVRVASGPAYCTGTLLDPETVLTCAHFLREHPDGISVKSGSRIRTVKTFETIPRTDIAILHIRAFQHLDGATFPQRRPGARPAFGSPTITFGFGGHARRMQVRQGRWLATIPLAMSRGGRTVVRPAGLVFNPTAAVKGDSGGPVIVDGKIVGVQSLVLDPFGKNLHVATVNVL